MFIPTFNEGETLTQILSQIPKEINGHSVDMVCVDDCSTDNTPAIARQFTSHVQVLDKNYGGTGMATRIGFEYIARLGGYRYVIKLDGDGQHRTDLLPEVVSKLVQHDLVICSRFHAQSDQTYTPVDRILLNMTFTELLRHITRWKLTDVRSGFMGFRFEDVVAIASQLIVPSYGIPMELILRLWHHKPNARVYEIPHPALYGPDVSKRLKKKYATERVKQKADRLHLAFQALLMVVQDLKIPKELLLEQNGHS